MLVLTQFSKFLNYLKAFELIKRLYRFVRRHVLELVERTIKTGSQLTIINTAPTLLGRQILAIVFLSSLRVARLSARTD